MDRALTSVSQALCNVARSNRIGRPVFVRWTATYERARESASSTVDEGLRAASAIFGGAPERTTRLGSEDAGNLSLLGVWAGGETALIAVGPAGDHRRAGYDVALIGSEGAAYHVDERWRDDG